MTSETGPCHGAPGRSLLRDAGPVKSRTAVQALRLLLNGYPHSNGLVDELSMNKKRCQGTGARCVRKSYSALVHRTVYSLAAAALSSMTVTLAWLRKMEAGTCGVMGPLII